MPKFYYTGVGSRETPELVCEKITELAIVLDDSRKWILRSGGAPGADSAFAMGTSSAMKREIYLPWERFNNNVGGIYKIPEKASVIAQEVMGDEHWNNCSAAAKKLHTRNVPQVLGKKLDKPSNFLICWTKEGKIIGGTATAIKLAIKYKVPVINLGDKDWARWTPYAIFKYMMEKAYEQQDKLPRIL